MTRAIFITGTNTDIGKTYITTLIAKTLNNAGISCGYYKAALSGVELLEGKLVAGDSKEVIETGGLKQNYQNAVSYVFEEALSPHLAAARANEIITMDKIKSDYKNIVEQYEYILVEGSGGIICPIFLGDEEIYLEDIVKELQLSVILVADSGLGTINHTILSERYLKSKGIELRGIILNNYEKNNFMHEDNEKIIVDKTAVEIIDRIESNATKMNISAEKLTEYFKEIV